MPGKLDDRRSVKRLLTKGGQFNHDNGNKTSCFYINTRSIRNNFVELKSYINQEKRYNFCNRDMGKNICTE